MTVDKGTFVPESDRIVLLAGGKELDAEGAARDGDAVYITGSQSPFRSPCAPRPDSRHVFRFKVDQQQNAIIGSFRNAWNARSGSGSPNGSFGISVGGEDPVLGQRIGYLASLSYNYGQEIRSGETKGLAASASTVCQT